jgi:hypothetical protein
MSFGLGSQGSDLQAYSDARLQLDVLEIVVSDERKAKLVRQLAAQIREWREERGKAELVLAEANRREADVAERERRAAKREAEAAEREEQAKIQLESAQERMAQLEELRAELRADLAA